MWVSAPMRHPYKLVNGAILGAGADVHVGQQAVGRHCDRGRRPLVVHAEHSARAVCVSRDHRFVAPRAVAFRDCHTRMRAYVGFWITPASFIAHEQRSVALCAHAAAGGFCSTVRRAGRPTQSRHSAVDRRTARGAPEANESLRCARCPSGAEGDSERHDVRDLPPDRWQSSARTCAT